RDIHDTLAQGFTSIVMLLEAADAEIGADDEAVRRHLALARSTARENLAEARSLVAALSPAGLADGSLVDAIRRLVSRCAEELQVRAAVSVTGDPRRLSSATEVVLLRAAQEGLANVRKHAGASQIHVYMDYGADLTTLRVCDDGSGFEPSVAEGFGLAGMRTRAEQAGGSLRLDSTPGAGTTIELRVPA
ncbi:MAG: sensor histidine kinase, partial [Geodermatophilaceae bacterium]